MSIHFYKLGKSIYIKSFIQLHNINDEKNKNKMQKKYSQKIHIIDSEVFNSK